MILAAFLLLPLPSEAQTLVQVGAPITFAWDQVVEEFSPVDRFVFHLNSDAPVTIPAPEFAGGVATHALPEGLPVGTYTVTVVAAGVGGSSAPSLPFSFKVVGPPQPPANLRIPAPGSAWWESPSPERSEPPRPLH